MMNIRGIIGISMFFTPYILNEHAGVWDLQLFRENFEPQHLSLNIVEKNTEELNSTKGLIPFIIRCEERRLVERSNLNDRKELAGVSKRK